jgi:hypothetical protein
VRELESCAQTVSGLVCQGTIPRMDDAWRCYQPGGAVGFADGSAFSATASSLARCG